MIRKKERTRAAAALLVFGLWGLSLLSCGGGTDGPLAGGGIGGTGVTLASSGVITEIGSIWVNGVEFGTDGARLEGETDGRSLDQLTVGMVVTVRGTVNADGVTGTAGSVTLEDELEGPVTQVTEPVPGTKLATVLGQTVVVQQSGVIGNLGTRFSGFADNTFGAFGADEEGDGSDVVEVSGFRRSDGRILATYIEKKAPDADAFQTSDDYEIEGVVAQPVGAGSFSIGGLTVIWNGSPEVTAGQLVEVKGGMLNGNTLTASSVEIRSGGFDDGEEVEIEGLVHDLDPEGRTFTLNGQPVDYSGAEFRNGTAASLADDVRVEVEGSVQGTTLKAEEVRIETQVELEGDVQGTTSSALTLKAFPAVTVHVDPLLTEFEGGASSLDGIAAGDHVRIQGRERAAGGVTASLIKTENGPKEKVVLQGPAEAPASPRLTILGVELDAGDFAVLKTASGGDATVDAFFAALAEGDIVMAGGTLSGNTVTWNELEIEE